MKTMDLHIDKTGARLAHSYWYAADSIPAVCMNRLARPFAIPEGTQTIRLHISPDVVEGAAVLRRFRLEKLDHAGEGFEVEVDGIKYATTMALDTFMDYAELLAGMTGSVWVTY